eukprot:6650705-Pyramimonas_sp.AAC.3
MPVRAPSARTHQPHACTLTHLYDTRAEQSVTQAPSRTCTTHALNSLSLRHHHAPVRHTRRTVSHSGTLTHLYDTRDEQYLTQAPSRTCTTHVLNSLSLRHPHAPVRHARRTVSHSGPEGPGGRTGACQPTCAAHCDPCLLYTSDAADDTPCVDL